jgi:pyruvate kinase
MDVARINLAHGTPEEHQRAVHAVRDAARDAGRIVSILVDLPGPKLRLGQLFRDPLELETDSTVILTGTSAPASGTSLPLADERIVGRLFAGDRILLADGAAELRVVQTDSDHAESVVVRGGVIRSRQGVSVPAARMPADALGTADTAVLPELFELRADFVGQSFVRSADDVELLRSRLSGEVRIVAKIETAEALACIDDILGVSDAIMVARGDLGVEVPFEQVPMAQKRLIRAALAAGKPSIVATQMLESMVSAPRPTRAEAGDVANAIIDGADAVMLSAETAVGSYPVEALQTAAAIAAATDGFQASTRPPGGKPSFGPDVDARALAVAAVAMADNDPDVVALVCYSHTGRTPRRLGSLRPDVPVVAFTPTQACAASLGLQRGIQPVVLEVDGDDPTAISEAVIAAVRSGRGVLGLATDDAIVLVQTSARAGPNALELVRV